MPSRSARARVAIRTSLTCLAIVMVVMIVPVCATLWLGGADWTLHDSVRLSWYDEWVAWPLLAALIGWLILASGDLSAGTPPTESRAVPSSRFALGFAALGLGLTAVAVGILWSGGVRFSFLSLGSPKPSAWGAIAFLIFSAFLIARPQRVSSARARLNAFGAILLALGLGLLLQGGLVSLDRQSMTHAMQKSARGEEPGQHAVKNPDVLWVVVDTLRADALGVYAAGAVQAGGGDAIVSRTPFLDSLAERGVLFERALAPAPWTVPSMFSAFTALWPSSLDPEGRGRARRADDRIGLDRAVPSWVDRLRENGYYAAAFQKNPFLGEGSGLETRFDLYRMVGGDRAEGESAGQLVNAALRWADAMKAHREGEPTPYLLYLHFMDPHIDYAPPSSWLPAEPSGISGTIDGRARTLHRRLADGPAITPAEGAELARLYAAEVAYLDSELARLWSGLEQRMLVGANTLVIVTGDHGEQFGEHGGWEHGDLFSENLHVPFLMAGDAVGTSPRRVSESVSLLDLGPTVLERLGLPVLEGAEGQSLLGDAGSSGLDIVRPIASEYGARARVEFGRWVWIESRGRGGAGGKDAALYDRSVDPREKKDQSMLRPEIAERLRAQLAAHRTRNRTGDRAEGERVRSLSRDRRLEQELKALGYGRSPE